MVVVASRGSIVVVVVAIVVIILFAAFYKFVQVKELSLLGLPYPCCCCYNNPLSNHKLLIVVDVWCECGMEEWVSSTILHSYSILLNEHK